MSEDKKPTDMKISADSRPSAGTAPTSVTTETSPTLATSENVEANYIGEQIADQLRVWRPDMDAEDVASAIMQALENYSMNVEGPGHQVKMRAVVNTLLEKLDDRIKHF